MSARTISEKILSAKSGREVHAGDIAVCNVDRVLGTDASSPMAIDYFERMGGGRLFDPSRVMFAFDHYSPPASPETAAFHDRVRAFAKRHGAISATSARASVSSCSRSAAARFPARSSLGRTATR